MKQNILKPLVDRIDPSPSEIVGPFMFCALGMERWCDGLGNKSALSQFLCLFQAPKQLLHFAVCSLSFEGV